MYKTWKATLFSLPFQKELPCISNVMLIGDRRKFLSCFLTFKVDVDPDTQEPTSLLAPASLTWCEEVGSKAKTVQDLVNGKEPSVSCLPACMLG